MNKIIKITFKKFTSSQVIPAKLKKKFYKTVDILEVKNTTIKLNNEKEMVNSTLNTFFNYSKPGEFYYQILLDGKKCKSMYQDEYLIPKKSLAVALAEEFARQKEHINLHSMQLNALAYPGFEYKMMRH